MNDPNLKNLPAFLLKLINLLDAPNFCKLVWWSGDGKSFVIKEPTNFAKFVLPAYFKHSNFQSFVRQLNSYGFRRVMLFDEHITNVTKESVAFYHKLFIKDRFELLCQIQRKTSKSRPCDELINEVNDLKDTQLQNSKSISSLRQENKNLWREVVSLRQKHSHQQKIINHLIKFFVSMVQHKNKGAKRKLPLSIEECDADILSFKIPRSNQSSPVHTGTPVDRSKYGYFTSDVKSPMIKEVPNICDVNIRMSQSRANDITLMEQPPKTPDCDALPQPTNDDFVLVDDFVTQQNNCCYHTQQLEERPSEMLPFGSDDGEINSLQDNHDVAETKNNSSCQPDLDDSLDSSFTPPEIPMSSIHDIVEPECSYKQSPTDDSSNSNSKLKNNLKFLQDKLSNNEPIHLDCELMQELFYGSVDLSSQSLFFDESLFSIPNIPVSGYELVQYNSDSATGCSSSEVKSQDSDKVDISELLKLLSD